MARTNSHQTTRRDRIVGWVFVLLQAILLLALVMVPDGTTWEATSYVGFVAQSLIAAAIGLGVWAIATFGTGITPSPVPSPRATLVTSGPFRWVRHPMYTAVMMAALGMTLRNASLSAIALLVAIGLFFNLKSRWEETRLMHTYVDYAEYLQRTGRFLPRYHPKKY